MVLSVFSAFCSEYVLVYVTAETTFVPIGKPQAFKAADRNPGQQCRNFSQHALKFTGHRERDSVELRSNGQVTKINTPMQGMQGDKATKRSGS